MNIVIAGGGKVGYTLAEQLSSEDNSITLIDNDPDVIDEAGDKLDIKCIHGNCVNHQIQNEAGVPKADLLIAATGADELNMLACLIAKKLGARHTIARVRNPEYVDQLVFMREELGLSMYINPEFAAAEEIFRTLNMPSASRIETFANKRVEVVETKVLPGTGLCDISLKDFTRRHRIRALICAVEREDDIFIPGGDFVIRKGDRVSVIASPADISAFFAVFDPVAFKSHHRVKTVMITGGSRIALYLARMLISVGIEVKIIESDKQRCFELTEYLPKAIIINGDGTDQSLLHEEGLQNTDAFVSLTGVDEENVIVSMYANSLGVRKVVTKLNRPGLMNLVKNVGLESFVSPRDTTANMIISYVRAMKNSRGSSVETLHRIAGGGVEALEFLVREDLPFVNVPLKDLRLKPNLLIGCISRGRNTIIPGGEDVIKPGDHVIVISEKGKLSGLREIMI